MKQRIEIHNRNISGDDGHYFLVVLNNPNSPGYSLEFQSTEFNSYAECNLALQVFREHVSALNTWTFVVVKTIPLSPIKPIAVAQNGMIGHVTLSIGKEEREVHFTVKTQTMKNIKLIRESVDLLKEKLGSLPAYRVGVDPYED